MLWPIHPQAESDNPRIRESKVVKTDNPNKDDAENWGPEPPTVLMDDPGAVPLEVMSQFQQYATNEYDRYMDVFTDT